MKIKINDHIEAVFGNKHKGHTGTVVNADRPFVTVRADKPYPSTAHA